MKKLAIVMTAVTILAVGAGVTYHIVVPRPTEEEEMLKAFEGGSNTPKLIEIEEGVFKTESGDKVLVTDENKWDGIVATQKTRFRYPIVDYASGKAFLEGDYDDFSDTNFVGILMVFENAYEATEIRNGSGRKTSRANEDNIYWNLPEELNTFTFDPGALQTTDVIIVE
ncbi:MAG: hypothetical protein Ta2A_12590 [Treponemataceae bacterium]|nr:MAG: hypothetical protein Ta2A_12590 [Treponemataceae bacterium]